MSRLVLVLFCALAVVACTESGSAAADQYDCGQNTPGTGDLSVDIVGRWFFVQNASAQYFTFDSAGTATRTWTSDENDDVTTTEYAYVVTGSVVEIEGYGDGAFDVVLGDDGLWTVPDEAADTDWIRCRRVVASNER